MNVGSGMIAKSLLLLLMWQMTVVSTSIAEGVMESKPVSSNKNDDKKNGGDGKGDKGSNIKNNDGKDDNVRIGRIPDTLSLILDSTIVNNKDLKSQADEMRATHEDIVVAKSAFRPHATFTAGRKLNNRTFHSRDKSVNPAVDATNKDRVTEYGIQIKQNLFRCGADKAACSEVEHKIKAKWAACDAQVQQVLRDTCISYFTIIAKQKEISHLKALLRARKESADVARRMLQAGTAKELDVLQADASTSETESKLAKAESEHTSYCAQFETMTGMRMPANPTIPTKMFDDDMPEDKAVALATKHNPEVVARGEECSAARETVRKINTEFYPSVDLTAGAENSHDSSIKKFNDHDKKATTKTCFVSLGVTVPIYDGGSSRAEKRKAQAIVLKSKDERDKVVDTVKSEVRAVWAAIRAAKQNLISAAKAVELRTLVLHDTMEEYKAGVKIMKDVLEAQSQLFEAQTLATQAEEQYFANQCRAIALLGRMSPRHLKLRCNDVDFRAHYEQTRRRM
ncbi:MAG: TolC family protein [Holosporales bacterium]|jgi:outer membrane protein|nr:TolC family protein [Holosporales bacterium]